MANLQWSFLHRLLFLHDASFSGPRELGSAADLINQYKLCRHHESFCKRSLPLSISETYYLHNVVGDTSINNTVNRNPMKQIRVPHLFS
ncbi:hypothetical protein C1H46_009660 [Malus baccata]|uniref:Uncharacterized protein n=1 Tax=Malus baccata TaxID=106549 RepID=A0A540N0T6_MALBA|nr:hypothetical protein C1H46_009660 [Malus baccata]